MIQKAFITPPDLSGVQAAKAHYLLQHGNLRGFEKFLDEVLDFSGLGDFIRLPIKGYSEGMASRLLFSLLTSGSYDCLALDEGFGTGDARFFERAQQRMKDFIASAGTLLLASHSDDLLRQFCTRGLVFSEGMIVYDGNLEAALGYYHEQHHRSLHLWLALATCMVVYSYQSHKSEICKDGLGWFLAGPIQSSVYRCFESCLWDGFPGSRFFALCCLSRHGLGCLECNGCCS